MSLAEEVPDLHDRSFSSLFSHALRGVPCRVLGLDGGPTELPVHEWTRAADPHDDALLAACVGDTLDVGCGPGRLAQRLAEGRDRRVLGIDVVPEAVAQTRARGVAALQGSVFDPIPREGRWHTALLADGNVGIGDTAPNGILHVAEANDGGETQLWLINSAFLIGFAKP